MSWSSLDLFIYFFAAVHFSLHNRQLHYELFKSWIGPQSLVILQGQALNTPTLLKAFLPQEAEGDNKKIWTDKSFLGNPSMLNRGSGKKWMQACLLYIVLFESMPVCLCIYASLKGMLECFHETLTAFPFCMDVSLCQDLTLSSVAIYWGSLLCCLSNPLDSL